MKSNEVETTLKQLDSFHVNVKKLSKSMKVKDKGECHFYHEMHSNTRATCLNIMLPHTKVLETQNGAFGHPPSKEVPLGIPLLRGCT